MSKEITDLIASMKNTGMKNASTSPPLPFTRQTITLSDIKVGDIVVVSAGGKNLSTTIAFTATTIDVQDPSPMPTIPSPTSTPTVATTTATTDTRPPPPIPVDARSSQQ